MKKRDLLFAGLLLIGASAFAQPVRTSQDAKEIFFQGFEGDFDTWSNEIVDSITELKYYNNTVTGTKNNFNIWEDANKADFDFNNNVVVRTDSVLYLKNGVMTTDDKAEIAAHNYDKDKYYTLEETSQDRKDAFALFGEKGGDYVFEYVSDTCHYAPSWSPSSVQTYTPEYRRNLFVRGIPIEDTTSYRLTFYVKAEKVKDGADPRMYVDLMRGYFHAEKRFSMGLQDDATHYKYKAQYYLEKHGWGEATDDNPDPFLGTGEWEKVTMMSYYTNDSIANSFVFIDGYWWDGDWTWSKYSKTPVPTDNNLIYTVQPDKFFVRLSFSSDDTKFQVDNISLTKSTIGGIEYAGSKLRVDFGYKTNLGELAAAAYEQNKIDAVEVKNDDNKYFTVWGLMGGTWAQIKIASAEYHGDGYMYMFTKEDKEGNPLSFDTFDSILVTFHNPVDQPALALKYVGDGKQPGSGYKPFDHVFPRAWDTAWVKAGKIVPDFYNEVGKKNPFAVQGVYSMKELPPVVQGTEFEENSFGLPANTSSIWIKFSRQVDFDNLGALSTKLIAKLGDEILTPSWETTGADGSGILTLTRTSASALKGDKELKLIQLKGIGTPEAQPVTFHYHFGDYNRVDPWTKKSDWRSEINITDNNGLWARPVPASLAYYYPGEGFFFGDGGNQYYNEKRTSLGLYKMNNNNNYGDCFWYLCANGTGTDPVTGKDKRGNLYTFDALNPGNYTLSFAVFGWGTTSSVTHIYLYKKPALIETYLSLDTLSGKTEIGKITKTKANKSWSGDEAAQYMAGGYDNNNLNWSSSTEIFEFPFTIDEAADYVIEWQIEGKGTYYQGLAFGNYTIAEKVSDELWFEPTNNLNKSVKIANGLIAKADAAPTIYGGNELDALKNRVNADKIGGTFTSVKPSEWKAEKDSLDKYISAYSTRMDNLTKMKDALDAIAKIEADYSAKQEAGMLDYAAALAGASEYASVVYTALTVDSITKSTNALNALIKNFNDYRAKLAELGEKRAASAKILDKYVGYDALAEYKAIVAAIEDNAEFDSIGSTKAALDAVVAAIASANSAFEGKLVSKKVYEDQIEAIAEFISALDADVEVPDEVEALDVLLDDKVGFYMLYAQEALYIALADGLIEEDDTMDVSYAFITNGDLMTPMTSAQLGARGLTNSDVINNDHPDAYPLGLEYFPGWKFTWTKGNPYIGGTSWGDSKVLATAGNLSNAYVNLDWNTGFTMEQTIAALPAGNYTLGVGYGIAPANNDGGVIILSMEGDTIVDSLFYSNANAGGTGKGTPVNNFFSFETEGGAQLIINPSCGDNGWNSFDNITLQFNGVAEGFDYGEAIADVEAAIDDKTTNVAPVKAAKAAKYYNINGVEQTAPKAGLNIKVENGVATKVFVK